VGVPLVVVSESRHLDDAPAGLTHCVAAGSDVMAEIWSTMVRTL